VDKNIQLTDSNYHDRVLIIQVFEQLLRLYKLRWCRLLVHH
jgi:hypothetical protein